MGFNHLQKIPAYLTTKDTTYNCEYSGTLVCRLVSMDVTAQGRAGVMSSRTVCAYVLLETHGDASILTSLVLWGALEYPLGEL